MKPFEVVVTHARWAEGPRSSTLSRPRGFGRPPTPLLKIRCANRPPLLLVAERAKMAPEDHGLVDFVRKTTTTTIAFVRHWRQRSLWAAR